MSKGKKITYWIATIWLAVAMIGSGLSQIMQAEGFVKIFVNLGYPMYLMYILGVWKILGVIAILIPKFGLVKEWAYAGFFFTMSGAAVSHIAVGDPFGDTAPALFLTVLTVLSWYFRPEGRKVVSLAANK